MAIIPDEYRQYVEAINGTGSSQFFWQNLTGIPLMYHTEYTISANYGDKTYFIQNTYDPIIASANNTNYMFYMPKKDIHINKVSGTQYSVNETYSYTNDLSLPPLWGSPNAYAQGFKINGGQLLASSVGSTITSGTYTYTDSGTLQKILTNLARKCRGINIYVDGVPWDDEPDGIIANGGGATHIAKVTGPLKDLSSYTSDILIVSGGGGGGLIVDENAYAGADAGGISGSGSNSGNQLTGYAFGQGESGTNKSGGGSGLYGGYKGGEIQITPTPPSDYSYLEGTKDFKWANTNTYAYESSYPLWYNAGWSNNPVSIENTSFVTGSSESYSEPENFGRNNITPYNLITADITDNGGTVTVAYSGNRLYWNPTGGQTYPTNYVAYVSPSAISNNRLQADGYDWCRSDYANIRSLQTSFNSLSTCCQYLYRYFRHININYNGTPWIYVGDSPETEYVGGGAGSGYIGNSLVSNKKMVGYNVPTSSAEGTKTESVNEVSESAVANQPKSGNGFVRIKFLRESN